MAGQLPAYQIDNAMINFQPLTQALGNYQRGAELAGRSTAQINAANAMQAGDFNLAAAETARSGDVTGAIALRRHPGEMQAQADQARDREVRRLAGQMQSIISMPDGPERAAAFRTWRDSDPRHITAMQAAGFDPEDHMRTPLAIHGEALGPRNPLDDERTRATIAASRASADKDRAAAQRSGIIEMSPGSTALDVNRREPIYTAPAAPPRPREMGVSDVRQLRGEGNMVATHGRLGETFRPEFAMPGTVRGGDVSNWWAQNMPENMTTPATRQRAQWWQDYRRNSELTERHELFGAALTPTEQASWRAASIHPNMNAEAIQESLRRQNEILTNGVRNYARGLVEAGYPAAAISQALGIPPEQLGIAGGTRRPGAVTAPQQTPVPSEGRTATNPQTGERIIFRNGQWQPLAQQ